ncbi:MAG: dephospho-CoA kinase [Synergistaceae bacterium]|nr:dephospho-CoA kinase [Synergistaceae bacterium]
MAVMAVTGDIGAGKSTVSKLLSEKFNSEVFDADKIAKNLWELETVKNQAVSRWGKSIIDSEGNIIKSKISEFIFTNKDEWEFCNNLIHPKVMAELEKLSLNLIM